MSATLLLIALVLAQVSPDKPVTEAEKKTFLELVAKLPTRGEFFAEEAIAKAAPHTRVLLALTEKDLDQRDLYRFVALSAGLLARKESRQYGLSHFDTIAHPQIKLFWALGLFRDKSPSPKIVAFLRKALDAKETARTIQSMTGPDFENFKEQVILASEQYIQTRVELVKKRVIDAFPEYSSGSGLDYTKQNMVFAPAQLLYAVHPHKHQGELIIYDLDKDTAKRRGVPQPQGFKARIDVLSYFENPVLSVNANGDLVCRWQIEGNGDHGLALLTKGGASFTVKRVKLTLADCLVLADRNGDWYLLQGAERLAVYHFDQNVNLKRLTQGHHSIGLGDARFIANGLLHLFWANSASGDNLRMRCVDFDVTRQKWFHNREIFRLNQFVLFAKGPTILQLADESLHYLWGIDRGAKKGDAAGLYYRAETAGKAVKVCEGYNYRAISVGKRVVVCYTLESSPEKVFFRVINHGVLGPVCEITAAKGRKDELRLEYMILYAEAGRIWFVNTLARNTLYELRLEDEKNP